MDSQHEGPNELKRACNAEPADPPSKKPREDVMPPGAAVADEAPHVADPAALCDPLAPPADDVAPPPPVEEEVLDPGLDVTTLVNLRNELAKAIAAAVGARNDWGPEFPGPTPEGGWEAKILELLERGAEVDGGPGFENDCYTPVHIAVTYDNEAVCKILLSKGADVNIGHSCSDLSGETPLHDVKSEAICQLLLDAGARLNTRGGGGNTALMMAAMRGSEPIVRMLLGAGADPTIFDTEGLTGVFFDGRGSLRFETAAKTARRCGHDSLAGLLEEAERSHPKRWKLIPCTYCGTECGADPRFYECIDCKNDETIGPGFYLCQEANSGPVSCYSMIMEDDGTRFGDYGRVTRASLGCAHDSPLALVETA